MFSFLLWKVTKKHNVQRIWSTVFSFSQNFWKSRTNLFGISLNLLFLWPICFLPFKPFEISKYLTEFIYIKLKKEKTKIQYNSSNFKEMKIILWNYMKISKIIFFNSSMQIILDKIASTFFLHLLTFANSFIYLSNLSRFRCPPSFM